MFDTASDGGRVRAVVIGAGMSGLLVSIKLREAGIDDFVILEKGPDLGGTWRENTYPGIACDVASHYYSFSFDPNPSWSSMLPGGGEIQDYLRGVAEKHRLRERIRFNMEVSSATHDGELWTLKLKDGGEIRTSILVACCGLLHHPRLPHIEGLDSFDGAVFHSARWDHNVPLRERRVGLIGNGSTGVQIISELAREGVDLTVFQRTPQWIFPLPNRRYGGWGSAVLRRFPALGKFLHRAYRVLYERSFATAVIRPGWQRRVLASLCRWNLKRVKDPELRRKLTPDYPPLCKRMVMAGGFYGAIQRENVELVVEDIERIEERGVRTRDGRLHEVDVLVLATGFDAHAYFRPLELENKDGLTVSQLWADGPVAHRTVCIPGFPNFFMTLGPQSPIGNYSAIDIAETQVAYIMECIKLCTSGVARTVTPTPKAAAAFNEMIRGAMDDTVWVQGCTSWYIAPNGVPSAWPFPPARFRRELARVDVSEFEVQR